MRTTDDEIHAVVNSPGTSYWLRQALQSALTRDCVDVANDAERLSSLLARRCDRILAGQPDHHRGNPHESGI